MSAMADDPATGAPDLNAPQGGFVERRRAAALASIAGLGGPKPTPNAASAETPAPAPETPAPQPEVPKPDPPPQQDDIAAIRKQEIHLRRQFAEREQQWQAEQLRREAEHKPRLERAERFEALVANDDVIGLLELAGYKVDDFDRLARHVYAHSPEGSKDPRKKAEAYQTKAQREAATQLQKMQERIEAFERKQAEEREQAAVQAKLDAYYSSVGKHASDETPITRARMTAAPDVVKARMLEIADRLYMESGPSDDLRDVPEPSAVLKAYERERRADLEDGLRALGIDPAAAYRLANATQAAPASQVNGQPKPSPTLTPGGSAATEVDRPGRKSREELIKLVQRVGSPKT